MKVPPKKGKLMNGKPTITTSESTIEAKNSHNISKHRSKRFLMTKEHREEVHDAFKEFKQFTNDFFKLNDQLFEFGKDMNHDHHEHESTTKSEAKH
jgi:hypothetical protein